MSLYQNFLNSSGRFVKAAYKTATKFARPIVNGIVQAADSIKRAASVLTIVPIVGQVAATVLSVSTAVYAVGTVVRDLLGSEPTPAPNVPDVIFDGDVDMEDAFNPVTIQPVERPTFDVGYNATHNREIAFPRGRKIYPRLRLDEPDVDTFDQNAEVPYDRPRDREAKRFQQFRPDFTGLPPLQFSEFNGRRASVMSIG